jgi:soluble lytic murein transglycosylase-like protein
MEYQYERTLQLVNLQPIKTEASIDEYVAVYAKEYRVPANLLKANMITESALNSDAYSPKGAIGLAQIMPANAKRCGVKKVSKLWDEKHNIRCGAQILAEELHTYNGDVVKALQSYNGGPGCINKCRESINHAQRVVSVYARLEYAQEQGYKDLG